MTDNNVWILGAGFAGLQAARRVLRRAPTARVTIVDRNSYNTMLPALPDVLSGRVRRERIRRSLRELFPERYRERLSIVHGTVAGVDLDARELSIRPAPETGRRSAASADTGLSDTRPGAPSREEVIETHRWDSLVIATGSVPAFFGFTPGDGAELYTVHSLESVERLREAFERRYRNPGETGARYGAPRGGDSGGGDSGKHPVVPVLIVGAGYTGLEVAASLRHGAEAAGLPQPEITVVEMAPGILPFVRDKDRKYIRSYLKKLDVDVRTGTALAGYERGVAILSDGTELRDPLVCWAAGMTSEATAIDGAVERSRDGRIKTNEFLQIPGYPAVFVAGDAAAIEKRGEPQRRAVNFAYYSGQRAGENCARWITAGGEAVHADTVGPVAEGHGGSRAAPPTGTQTVRASWGRGGSKAAPALKPFHPVDLGWVIPLGGISVGTVFGVFHIRGRLGLRLHYLMCGFRHVGIKEAWEFYKTAVRLRRAPDPPSAGLREDQPDPPGAGPREDQPDRPRADKPREDQPDPPGATRVTDDDR